MVSVTGKLRQARTGEILRLLQRIDQVSGEAITIADAPGVVDEGVVALRLERRGEVWEEHLLDAVELRKRKPPVLSGTVKRKGVIRLAS